MNRFLHKYFLLLLLSLLCLIFGMVCVLIQEKKLGETLSSVERIKKSGTLRLITSNSMNTFYLYRGKPDGFEYDLAKEFAKHLNVDLDVVTPGWNNMFSYLKQGKGDFIAAGLAITKDRLEQVAFSIPYMTIQQRVVHHNLIFGPKNIQDLEFRTIHVRRGTSYQSRLEEIKRSGVDFKYILHDNTPTEDLIAMVNDRKIKFTIADSNIALLCQRYYPDIRIGIPVQERESLAWAIRKNDDDMLKAINRFLLHANETGILKRITQKYYHNIQDVDLFEIKKFHDRMKSRFPKYKKLIQKESRKYGFDWRLVAAVIYQESQFDANARSFTNVRGLMQVTRATAEELGIANHKKPGQSIKAGIKYLNKMFRKFDHMEDEHQQMLFALASYNVGYGHVTDAMKITRKKGLADNNWQDVKTVLPLLSKARYYKKTKHGYARGWEPVQYVDQVLTYFDILKKNAS
ncbi:membrane-bound lytic murein transglycosylase MltF [Desulfospira joergensenii]|uniref:membrane-bound lytic murein transglycosylase MltF n=1 Tax=Desulfospira joergensenii TaxID=53329 RepID=UPI0003B30A33|nr:membrane-bound lytic murein transglycosylase MltF [Desulfospira joergensenii]